MKSGPDRLSPIQTPLNAPAVIARVESFFNFPPTTHDNVMATLGEHSMGPFTAEVVDWSPNGYVRDRRGRVYYDGFFVGDSCVTYREGLAYPRDWASGVLEKSYTLVGADPLSGQAVELGFSVDDEGVELGLLTASTHPVGFLTNFHAPETMARLLAGARSSELVAPTYYCTNVRKITDPFEQLRLARALGLVSGNSAAPSPSGYSSAALPSGRPATLGLMNL